MSTNSKNQDARELDAFNRFIPISNLAIIPNSVRKRPKPEPDILCHHQTEGPIAFELTELINEDFAAKTGWQAKVQDAIIAFHDNLPAIEKDYFDQYFGNAEICFNFLPDVSKKKICRRISAVFGGLSEVPPEYVGEWRDFKSKVVRRIVQSVSISRSKCDRPVFSVKNIIGAGDSIVPAIEKKLSKKYETDHPIELLGYLDIAAVFPSQLWRGSTNRFFSGLSDTSPFRRIWIVDIRNQKVELIFPPKE